MYWMNNRLWLNQIENNNFILQNVMTYSTGCSMKVRQFLCVCRVPVWTMDNIFRVLTFQQVYKYYHNFRLHWNLATFINIIKNILYTINYSRTIILPLIINKNNFCISISMCVRMAEGHGSHRTDIIIYEMFQPEYKHCRGSERTLCDWSSFVKK